MNKQTALLKALKTHRKGLTVIEIWKLVGASQVQDLIKKLRSKGHDITCIMTRGTDRYGHAVRYGMYKLIKEAK